MSYLYLHQAWIAFGITLLRKQGCQCLLRDSLAYIFSGFLIIWMQYVNCICGKKGIKNSCLLWQNKGFRQSPGKQLTSFSIVTLKCCFLQRNLGKHVKFFCLHDQRNSRRVLKLGVWRTDISREGLLRFSALKMACHKLPDTH